MINLVVHTTGSTFTEINRISVPKLPFGNAYVAIDRRPLDEIKDNFTIIALHTGE